MIQPKKFSQCHLRKHINGITTEMVSFIPANIAKVGMQVSLKDDNGVLTNGWTVIFVGATVDKLPDYRRTRREHRKNTGDSIKKT